MSKLTISPVIHLEITSACDANCPGCWGPPREIQNRPLEDFKAAIKKLKSFGLSRIILTGGEPTLIPKVDEFIKYAKEEVGLDVVLQTNGSRMIEVLQKAASAIDMVAISLEASKPELDFRRGEEGFKRCVASIKYVIEKHPEIELKIGTCVFQQNIDDLENIGNLLLDLGFGSKTPGNEGLWKFYEIQRLGKGENDPLLDTMLINTEDFNERIDKLKEKFAGKLNITREANNTVNPEIIVRPNGEVIITGSEEGQDEVIAEHNLFDEFEETLKDILVAQNRQKDLEELMEVL